MNKRIRYVRVYTILKRHQGAQANFLTKLFMRILTPKSTDQSEDSTIKKWI